MLDFIPNIPKDLHPIIVHFPIALLMLSFVLTFAARFLPRYDHLHENSWLLLLIGSLMAILATITGLIAHEPYEATALITFIEPHQFLGIFGTLIFVGLMLWRGLSRSKGNDVGQRNLYLALAGLGLLWLFMLGGTGGNLVYEHAVNIRGINPLLP